MKVVFLRKNLIKSMELREKMANLLKEQYSNLGSPQDVLNCVAGMAIVGLPEDAAEEVIAERINSAGDMLRAFQSNADKRVSDAIKATKEGIKGGKVADPNDGVDNSNGKEEPSWLSEFREENTRVLAELQAKIAALEGTNARKSFDERVNSAAKAVGLKGDLLVLAKANLSPDMDDATIANKLGAIKKTLIESGAKVGSEERNTVAQKTREEALRAEEREWVKQQKEKSSAQNV